MTDFSAILCSRDQQRIIAALPIRFQRMIVWAGICLRYHADDLLCIDEVYGDCIYIMYPTKSGINGAIDLVEQMNFRYTYDFDNHDMDVAELSCVGDKKRIKLRWCNNTVQLSKSYLGRK